MVFVSRFAGRQSLDLSPTTKLSGFFFVSQKEASPCLPAGRLSSQPLYEPY